MVAAVQPRKIFVYYHHIIIFYDGNNTFSTYNDTKLLCKCEHWLPVFSSSHIPCLKGYPQKTSKLPISKLFSELQKF